MKYELRLYDEPLIEFDMMQQPGEKLIVKTHRLDENRLPVFPLELTRNVEADELIGFSIDELAAYEVGEERDQMWKHLSNGMLDKRLAHWLINRTIPKNREFVEKILASLGLSQNDTKGIIDICKGLSLNDSFWVVPEGFTGPYAKYNLYDNKFSSALSLVAYTGCGSGNTAFTTSPELTTHGVLPKAWRRVKGKIVLYKGGTSGFANAGKEPYSEYYASQIAQRMELHAVQYGLSRWKGILASTCELFTNIDTAYVPIGRIVRSGGYKAVSAWLKKQDAEYRLHMHDEFCDMMVFDALIYNVDRHFGNFGILRDNKTGDITGFAPIFDNGLGLFKEAMPDDMDRLDSYRKKRLNATSESFESYVKMFGGKRQKEQLRRLINFKFSRHPSYNLPSKRLQIMERFVQDRVSELLGVMRGEGAVSDGPDFRKDAISHPDNHPGAGEAPR